MKRHKKSMIDKNTDDKETVEVKKIYNHYLDKRLICSKTPNSM